MGKIFLNKKGEIITSTIANEKVVIDEIVIQFLAEIVKNVIDERRNNSVAGKKAA